MRTVKASELSKMSGTGAISVLIQDGNVFPDVEKIVFDAYVDRFMASNRAFPNLREVEDKAGEWFMDKGCLYYRSQARNVVLLVNVFSQEKMVYVRSDCTGFYNAGDRFHDIPAEEIIWEDMPVAMRFTLEYPNVFAGSGWLRKAGKTAGPVIFNGALLGFEAEPADIRLSSDEIRCILPRLKTSRLRLRQLTIHGLAKLYEESSEGIPPLIHRAERLVLEDASSEDVDALRSCNGFPFGHMAATCGSIQKEVVFSGQKPEKYSSIHGMVYDADGKVLVYTPPAMTVPAFPATLERIAYGGIVSGENGIKNIQIPETVRHLSGGSVYLMAKSAEVRLGRGITRLPECQPFRIHESSVMWLHTKRLVIPGTLKHIGTGALCGVNAEEVEIQDGVEDIGAGAFARRGIIKKIEIPKSVKYASPGSLSGIKNISFARRIPDIALTILDTNILVSEITVLETGESYSIPLLSRGNLAELNDDIEIGRYDETERKWFGKAFMGTFARSENAETRRMRFLLALEIVERWPDEKKKKKDESKVTSELRARSGSAAMEAVENGSAELAVRIIKAGLVSPKAKKKILDAAQDRKMAAVCVCCAEEMKKNRGNRGERKSGAFSL